MEEPFLSAPKTELRLPQRPLLERWFSPMGPGSLRMMTLFLVTSATGAGLVSMPAVFKTSGLIGGFLMMAFAILSLHQTITMTAKCHSVLGFTRYGQIAEYLGGPKLEKIAHWAIILSVIMSIMVHNVILLELISTVLYRLGWLSVMPNLEHPTDPFRIISLSLLSLCQTLLYTKAQSPNKMKMHAIISLLCLGAIVGVLVYEFPAYVKAIWPEGDFNYGVKITARWPRDMSVFLYSFSVCGNAIIAIQTLNDPTPRRLVKVSRLTNGYLAAIYTVITLLAYLSTLEATPSIFLSRELVEGLSEWPMQIVRCGLALCLNTSNVGLFSSLRASVTQVRLRGSKNFEKDSLELNLVAQDLMTAAALTILALLFPQILTTLSLIGGSTGVMLTAVPIIAALKAEQVSWLEGRASQYLVVMAISVVLGAYTTVFDFLVYLGYRTE